MTGEEADDMGDDQPDESDKPGKGNRGTRQQRRKRKQYQPNSLHVQPQRMRTLIPQRQDVKTSSLACGHKQPDADRAPGNHQLRRYHTRKASDQKPR